MVSKFAQGTDALQQASKGAAFARTAYFSIEDGSSEIVRLMTEANINPATPHLGAWITVQQHQGVPTRPRPDWLKEDAKWPDRWGCVCRLTKAEGVPGEPPLWTLMEDKGEEHGEGCFIDAHVRDKNGKPYRASGRGWAIGCLREEVRDGNGILQGYKDKTREVERTNADGTTETVTEKCIVVFNMGWKNFFSVLDGFAAHYGTVVDRDYSIKRKGEGTSTQYQIVPLDPIPGYDLRDPAVYEKYHHPDYDLDTIIEDQARISYQRRWFDPTYTPPKKDDDSGNAQSGSASQGAPVAQQAKVSNDVDDEAMKAMMGRVSGYGSQPPADGEQQPAADASAPDAQPAAAAAPAGGGLQNIE